MPSFVDAYLYQVLSSESDTYANEEAVESSKVFLKTITGLSSIKKLDSYTFHTGLVSV